MAGNGTRVATINVRIPTHVPKDLYPLWHAAAQHTENSGKMRVRMASGKTGINYRLINAHYQRSLLAYAEMARKAGEEEVKEDKEEEKETKKDKKASANWPFSDISPTDVAKFAAAGNWGALAKIASMGRKASA